MSSMDDRNNKKRVDEATQHRPLPGEADAVWPADATRDALVGGWSIYQRKRGHRTSTDDVLTAAHAIRMNALRATPAASYLDIGCGIGSVLLLSAHTLRPARALGVEAQAQSALMASRTVEELPEEAPPIRIEHGDLRELVARAPGRFDLVTGSPPYFPTNAGVLPADAQRRACRFELRGGIEEYATAAAGLLAPGGVFVAVFQSQWSARVHAAGEAAGLRLVDQVDVHMKERDPAPFLSTYAFVLASDETWRSDEPTLSTFAIRDADGEITSAYHGVRATLGYPVP